MKKIALLFFLIIFSLSFVSAGLKHDLSDIIAKTPTEKISVIILFHEKPQAADISIIKSDGASIKYQYTIINAIAAKVPAQAAEKIAKRDFVKLVEPDYEVKLVLDKSVSQIQVDKIWEAGITGKNIDVAVLDTGIHKHLSLTIEKEVDFTGEGTDDLHGHGTHVAGIIASNDSTYRGIAYDADLFNVKVLNKDGIGYASDVIAGIEWAIDNNAEIISMSLGAKVEPCDGTDALSQAVDRAVSKGVIVVVAAGNFGPDYGTITSPGCSKAAITVGAVDDYDNVASWSSRGPTDDGRIKPDLVAPGVGITSTWPTGFKSLSGTSMSTPHVSGVAALLLEITILEPNILKNILKSTALDLGLDENTQGAGRVDAYNAYIYTINLTKNETADNKTCYWLPPGLRKKEILPKGWQKKCPEAGITPDSLLYHLERFFEKINLFFTFDKGKKAEKYLKYSEERLAEIAKMIEENKTKLLNNLIEDYRKSLEKSEGAELAVSALIHTEIFKEFSKKIPEAALQKATNYSQKKAEKVLNVLEPEVAADIHFRIAEKKLAIVKEKIRAQEIEEAKNLIEEYEKEINKSSEAAEVAKNLGRNTTKVEQLIAESISKHLEVLSRIHEKVPEPAKPAIEKAMETSINGREKAVEALKEKNALGEIPEKPKVSEEAREKIEKIEKREEEKSAEHKRK